MTQQDQIELPSWHEAERNCLRNNETPLDRFIFDNEPSVCDAEWRQQLTAVLQAAIEHDRKGRGEPVAWPRNAKEIRCFIDIHFISMTGGDEASDDDKYLLTAHDLLSAFEWWADVAPQPAEPVKVPSAISKLIDRIEQSAPMDVAGRGKYLHDLRTILARYGQPTKDPS